MTAVHHKSNQNQQQIQQQCLSISQGHTADKHVGWCWIAGCAIKGSSPVQCLNGGTAALSHGKDGSLRNEHIQLCSAPVIQGSRHEEAQLVCTSLIGDKAARNLLHTFRGCKMGLCLFPF